MRCVLCNITTHKTFHRKMNLIGGLTEEPFASIFSNEYCTMVYLLHYIRDNWRKDHVNYKFGILQEHKHICNCCPKILHFAVTSPCTLIVMWDDYCHKLHCNFLGYSKGCKVVML